MGECGISRVHHGLRERSFQDRGKTEHVPIQSHEVASLFSVFSGLPRVGQRVKRRSPKASGVQPVDEFASGNGFYGRKPHGFRFALPMATFLRPIRGVPTAICLGFGVTLHKAEGLPFSQIVRDSAR